MALNLIESQKVPGRTGPPATEVYQLWVENPEGLRVANYGSRRPQQALPHDHGNRRGLNREAPLCQSSLGPQGTPGGAVGTWAAGVPLLPASGVDFGEEPKLLWAQRVDVVGGVKEIYVEVVIEYAGGTGEVELRAQLRPLEEHGMTVGQGIGSSPTATHSLTGAARATRNSFAFANLQEWGSYSYDRVMLVEIWLNADPTNHGWRLCSVAVIPGTPDTGNPYGEPLEFRPPRVAIDIASINTGKIVQTEVVQSAHQIWNQLSQEVLGGTPGMNTDGTPNASDPFRRVITRRHRHQGRNYIDPETGLRTSDGAILNYPLGEAVFTDDLGDNGTNLTTSVPVKGLKLHPAGTLSLAQGWLQVEQRLEAPMGLTDFLLQAAISPATTNNLSRLWWYIKMQDLGGNAIECEWVATGSALDTTKSGAFSRALVEPIDGFAWQQNSVRLGNRLGLWTQRAAKVPLPEEVRGTESLARITKVMRIRYAPTQTGPIRLFHAWALEYGPEDSATYDTDARLLALKVWPAPGY